MTLRLTNVKVFDPTSEFHLKTTNISIEDGKISQVGDIGSGESIDLSGKVVTKGWVDLNAHFNEPGMEHKEDLISGMACASSGGFTDVCLIPNTEPPVETKGGVQFVIGRSEKVTLWPMAALSEGLKGENLTEILDLNEYGAVAFTDGLNPIWNTELLLKGLQYVQRFEGLVIDRPKDRSLSHYAQMHEGMVSTSLGLAGEPTLAEELAVIRDIEVLKYAGGRLHFSQLSSLKGVELVRKAKESGLQVTCDVSVGHLLFNDECVKGFDTSYKVDPPFRRESDRKALIEGLIDGTIDAIVSAHRPHDKECKELEYDLADFGITGLQTMLPALLKLKNELPFEVAIGCLTDGPRRVMGLGNVKIEMGSVAKLTILDMDDQWVLNEMTNVSKSNNSPFWGKALKGKVYGTVNGKYNTLERG